MRLQRLRHLEEALEPHLTPAAVTGRTGRTTHSPDNADSGGSQDPTIAALAPGAGAIIDRNGTPMAVHRDAQGVLHTLSAVCTHLGCTVGWNPADQTWTCPCHGSIFSATGTVLYGPAAKPLERVDISQDSDTGPQAG